MNEIMAIWTNEEFGDVRSVEIDGDPWFVGKDVAAALGYSNTKDALGRHVDPEDKRGSRFTTPSGEQEMTIINESGLYSLVMSSKLPGAKKFKRWITSEVIPSIRKHGAYMTPKTLQEMLDDPGAMIEVLQRLREEQERRKELETVVSVKDQQIAEMTPKAGYYDLILMNKDVMPISKIAKDYGMSAQRMNILLHEMGVQYKQGDIWLLYQQYAGEGYTHTKTDLYVDGEGEQHTKVRTCWTQKGRLFIYDLLKNKYGILPLIEREVEAS